jgi:hypothetical protein
MAWVLWLLAPVASTVLGAIVIWWRNPAGTGRRWQSTDAISEHQALLRALARTSPAGSGRPVTEPAADHSAVD